MLHFTLALYYYLPNKTKKREGWTFRGDRPTSGGSLKRDVGVPHDSEERTAPHGTRHCTPPPHAPPSNRQITARHRKPASCASSSPGLFLPLPRGFFRSDQIRWLVSRATRLTTLHHSAMLGPSHPGTSNAYLWALRSPGVLHRSLLRLLSSSMIHR